MPIILYINNKAVPCYTILDICSNCSYVLKSTADILQCKPSRTVELSIRGVFSEDTVSSNLVQLHIGPFNSNSAAFTLQSFYSVETLLIDFAKLNIGCSRFDHLRHVAFPNLVDNSVHILLGVDAFWHIAKKEILEGPAGSAYGVRNLLGWTIPLPLHQKSVDEQCNYHLTNSIDIKQHEDTSLNETVEKFWEIEESGTISIVTKGLFSSKHTKQLEFMEKSIQHDGTRYRINLLWKNNITMPNNYIVAKAQPESLQIQKGKPTMQLYDQSLSTDIDKGYVIPVTFLHPPPPRIWYLPHHPVINPQKPGKVRRATNAASKFRAFISIPVKRRDRIY